MKIPKIIGLLAILPLLTVALTSSYISDADALSSRGHTMEELQEQAQAKPTRDDTFKGHSGAKQVSQPVAPSVKAKPLPEAKPASLVLRQMDLDDEMRPNNIAIDAQKSTKGFVPRGDDYGLETYRAAYTVANEGDGKVWNIQILVKSDFETVKGELLGFLDEKHSSITVEIKAKDPSSISGKILGFETTS